MTGADDFPDVVATTAGPLVSVIIPSFNVSEFLDDCVASVLGQSHREVEVILVDDGSTDDTGVLADRWVVRDGRIVVIHQPNQGLGAARNSGIDASTGEFLFFLDGDDLLPSRSVERLVASAVQSGSDIVSGVAWRFDSLAAARADQYRSPFDTDVVGTHLFREPLLVHDQMACSKLFRREFWDREELVFPTGTVYEDLEVVMKAHCRAGAVDLVSSPSYCWRRRESGGLSITQDRHRPGSTTARFDALRRADAFLRDEAPAAVWVAHGVKVLLVDIRMYSRLLEGADEAFANEFTASAGRLASAIAPDAVAAVNPVMRQLHGYLMERNSEGVIACTRLLSGDAGRPAGRLVRGVAWLARHDARALIGLVSQAAATSEWKQRVGRTAK